MLFYDEKIYSGQEMQKGVLPVNEAQLIGSGPFTTMKVENGNVQLYSLHLNRLRFSLKYLFNQDLDEFLPSLNRGIAELLTSCEGSCSLRVSFFQNLEHTLDFFILKRKISIKSENVNLDLSEIIKGVGVFPSFLKIGPFAEIFHEIKMKSTQGINELVFINYKDEVLECSTSNIFILKKGQFYTPRLNSQVLDGVMRKMLIRFLDFKGIELIEKVLDKNELNDADEIMLTNALHVLTSVKNYKNRKLNNKFYLKLKNEFDQYVRNYDKSFDE